jgi:hypothetical protein
MAEQIIVKFPTNPVEGTIYEVGKGVYYRYESMTKSWNRVSTAAAAIPLATLTEPGLMPADDVRKTQKLMLPPLETTITGGNCPTNFVGGVFDLKSVDSIVNISGKAEIRNVDEFGQVITETQNYQISENTYAFDFTVDLEALTTELAKRDNFKTGGIIGDKGPKGPTGDPGNDFIISGMPGPQGKQGSGPGCALTVEPESFVIQAGGKALVDARLVLDPCDPSTYKIEFDRQAVGISKNSRTALPPTKVAVNGRSSKWVMVAESILGALTPYYLDVSQIESAIKEKFDSEVLRMKAGYENTVNYWLQKMSDLYDEQKTALCAALEFCTSAKKNTALRQHLENVAATAAISGAKVTIVNRNDPEASTVSGNSLLASLLPTGAPLGGNSNNFPAAANQSSTSVTATFANVTVQEGGTTHGGVTIVDGTAYYPNGSTRIVDQAAVDAAARAQTIAESNANAIEASVNANGGDGAAAKQEALRSSKTELLYVRMTGENGYIEGFLPRISDEEFANQIVVFRQKRGTKVGNSSWSIKASGTENTGYYYATTVNVSGLIPTSSNEFVQFSFNIKDSVVGERNTIDFGTQKDKNYEFIWERIFAQAGVSSRSTSAPPAVVPSTPPTPATPPTPPAAPPPAQKFGAIDPNIQPYYCLYHSDTGGFSSCIPVKTYDANPEAFPNTTTGKRLFSYYECGDCPYPTADSIVNASQWNSGVRPSAPPPAQAPLPPTAAPGYGGAGIPPFFGQSGSTQAPPSAPPSVSANPPAPPPYTGGGGLSPGEGGAGIPPFIGQGQPPSAPPSNQFPPESFFPPSNTTPSGGPGSPGFGGAGIPPNNYGGSVNVPPAAPSIPFFNPPVSVPPAPPTGGGGISAPGAGGAGIPPQFGAGGGSNNVGIAVTYVCLNGKCVVDDGTAPVGTLKFNNYAACVNGCVGNSGGGSVAPSFPPPGGGGSSTNPPSAPPMPFAAGDVHEIDPVLHNNKQSGLMIVLDEGIYKITVLKTSLRIDGKYKTDLRVSTIDKVYRMVNKGSFDLPNLGSMAYEGMSMMINHKIPGGIILFTPAMNPANSSGQLLVRIDKVL